MRVPLTVDLDLTPLHPLPLGLRHYSSIHSPEFASKTRSPASAARIVIAKTVTPSVRSSFDPGISAFGTQPWHRSSRTRNCHRCTGRQFGGQCGSVLRSNAGNAFVPQIQPCFGRFGLRRYHQLDRRADTACRHDREFRAANVPSTSASLCADPSKGAPSRPSMLAGSGRRPAQPTSIR